MTDVTAGQDAGIAAPKAAGGLRLPNFADLNGALSSSTSRRIGCLGRATKAIGKPK